MAKQLRIANIQSISIKFKNPSEKLSKATVQELNDFKISPSGYVIHWKLLDEDLSVNGLLKLVRHKASEVKVSPTEFAQLK